MSMPDNTSQKNEQKLWNDELGGFVFVSYEPNNLYFQEFSDINSIDVIRVFYLFPHMNYKGYLVCEDIPMTKKAMFNVFNSNGNSFSKSRFYIFLKKLVDTGIINYEGYENKKIKFNSKYFFKGKLPDSVKMNNGFTRVYIDSIKHLFENTTYYQQRKIGVLFKMIPFIHKESNIISYDPNSSEDCIEPIGIERLSKALGYNINSFHLFLKGLQEIRLQNGEPFMIMNNSTVGRFFVMINPRVVYGGNSVLKWYGKFLRNI